MTRSRLNKKKVERTVSGEIDKARRVSDSACTGTVTLNIQRNGVTLFPSAQVDVKPDCTYSLSFTTKENKKKGKPKPKYDVAASFSGNGTLLPDQQDPEVRAMTARNESSSPKGGRRTSEARISVWTAIGAASACRSCAWNGGSRARPGRLHAEHPVRPVDPDVQAVRGREWHPQQHARRICDRHDEPPHDR